MTNQTIEQAVEEIVSIVETVEFLHGVPVNLPSQYKADLRGVARKALQAQRDAGDEEKRVEKIKSELQSDSFTGCILRILQDFASIQEPTNKHYLEASTRVSNTALFYAKIDGGKIMFNTIEEALTPPTK